MRDNAVRSACFIFGFVILSLLGSLPDAMAQDHQITSVHPDYTSSAHQSSRFLDTYLEITPIAGYTLGGSFEDTYADIALKVKENKNYGIIIDIFNEYDTQFEFFFSHQPTELKINEGPSKGDPLFDLDISYFHIGGNYSPYKEDLNFYLAGGLGLTHLNPERGDSETKFSLSLGVGLELFLTDHLGFRLEGRGFGTYYHGSEAIFCSNGNCTIYIRGDVLWQFTVFSGLILRF